MEDMAETLGGVNNCQIYESDGTVVAQFLWSPSREDHSPSSAPIDTSNANRVTKLSRADIEDESRDGVGIMRR